MVAMEVRLVSDAERLLKNLIDAACSDNRRQQLALFSEDALWMFPLASEDGIRQLLGKEKIAQEMNPRWEAADAANLNVALVDVKIRPFADASYACSQFSLAISSHGHRRVRHFAHILRSSGGLISELIEYG